MTTKLRIHLSATLDEDHPRRWYLTDIENPDSEVLSDEAIREILEDQAGELLEESGTTWTVKFEWVEVDE